MQKKGIIVLTLIHCLLMQADTGYVDEENSTSTALEANATFTGKAVEVSNYSSIVVALYGTPSSATGTLYMDFSVDGINWDSNIPVTITNPSSALPHTLIPTRRYFRTRYVNDGVAHTAFRLQTLHHTNKSKGLTLRIGGTLTDNTDADPALAVLVGKQPDGDYVKIPASGSAFNNVSDGKSTLNADEVYTSAWIDTDGFNLIELFITSNVTSATDGLEIQFTDDVQGSQTRRFSRFYTFGSSDVTNGYQKLTIPTALDGFRVIYTNGTTQQTNFYLEATLKTNGIIDTVRLNTNLDDDTEANLTRSVLVGKNPSGTYANIAISDDNSLGVNIQGQGATTAFGELAVAQATSRISEIFNESINTDTVVLHQNQSGSVSHAFNMAKIATGAKTHSGAELITRETIPYTAGQGCVGRFQALFTTGVANSTQYIGSGNSLNGFFFGYNGTNFGVCSRKGGTPEVRTLTITTASAHTENAIITLDNRTKTVPVQNASANKSITAYEIADGDYSNVGCGWTAKAVGETVIFQAWQPGPRSGSYGLSATSAVGTFAQDLVGTDTTDTFIAQSSWNQDTFDGTGPSGITLDTTQINGYQIRYEWSGSVSFAIENPSTGNFNLCHVAQYTNNNTTPQLTVPTLPMYAGTHNLSNSSNINVQVQSFGGFYEGKGNFFGPLRGFFSSKTSITTAEIPLLSIRNKILFNNTLNSKEAKVKYLNMSVEHSKPMVVSFYSTTTLKSANFTAFSSNSILESDTNASQVINGNLLFSAPLGKSGNIFIDLANDIPSAILRPGDIFTITAKTTSLTGAEANVGVNVVEYI